MKKLFMALLIAASFTTSAFADANISPVIIHHFTVEFKNAKDIAWTNNPKFIKASFTLNNQHVEAFYNFDATVIAVSKSIGFDKLPTNAIRTISKQYSFLNYQIQECIELTNAEGEKHFYVSFIENGKAKIIIEVDADGSVDTYKK